MSFFNKFLNKIIKPAEKEGQSKAQEIQAGSIDEAFVKKFIHKGGKFLYCSDQEEVERNLMQVLQENQWNNVISHEEDLHQLLTRINSARTKKIIPSLPFLTFCECLVADDGSIMFSSRQLKDKKLKDLPSNFIVFAKTSQIVKDGRDGISGIRSRSEKNAPTIISSIKDFIIDKSDTDFMSYGLTNSKTLYLLLLEDL
ncbi:MAG: LUD domain-containing protein [Lutimonas sp.]